ncbi:MAG: hypothetical protein JSS83_20845 [Cyanobacteria bacterium SZAS LIN-3]|nr:hypothetical protein [Cyanobacteria bacterium SZAS LIN-3]MBS2010596.1 hypothetical protein [Cyanobacteria bacterium SZAS TMP-1]
MQASNTATPSDYQAGPVVPAQHPAVDRTVQVTAMHAAFTIQSVQDWIVRDDERLEAGTPDTLVYLTQSIRFLMTVTEQNQAFVRICRQQKATTEEVIAGIEQTFAALQAIGFDVARTDACSKLLRLQSAQLEAGALSHEATVEFMTGLFNRLQERLEVFMRAPGVIGTAARPN